MARTGIVTFKGGPMTLEGDGISVGQPAPDFTVIGSDMGPLTLSSLKGNVVILLSVPSLDTPVCSVEAKKFNDQAAGLNAKLLLVSLDLPFAQKRYCAAEGADNLVIGSDYKDHSFCAAFGLRIAELGLLARAVYVIDADGKIAYEQIVGEVAEEPDYDKALEAAKAAGA